MLVPDIYTSTSKILLSLKMGPAEDVACTVYKRIPKNIFWPVKIFESISDICKHLSASGNGSHQLTKYLRQNIYESNLIAYTKSLSALSAIHEASKLP